MTSTRRRKSAPAASLEPYVVLGDGERGFLGDAVRIGRGEVLWTIEDLLDGETIRVRNDLNGRTRTLFRQDLNLSAHENPAWY